MRIAIYIGEGALGEEAAEKKIRELVKAGAIVSLVREDNGVQLETEAEIVDLISGGVLLRIPNRSAQRFSPLLQGDNERDNGAIEERQKSLFFQFS